MIRSGASQKSMLKYLRKKLKKYIKSTKRYKVQFNHGNDLIVIVDKKSKRKNKRIFSIDKGSAYYYKKGGSKKKKIKKTGYWHYHLPNGEHYQPWFLAPDGLRIIK